MKKQDNIFKRSKITSVMNNQKGLTLIEILVALMIITLIILAINFNFNGDRDKMVEVGDEIERAIRFASHEAILQNTTVRIRFLLDKNPQEWALEFTPESDFILPLFMADASGDQKGFENLSLEEKENREKLVKNLNQQFSKIKDYQDENKVLPTYLKVVGFASNLQNKLLKDGDVAIYFTPSGEKDATLLIFSTESEMMTLKIDPYSEYMEREYYTLPQGSEESILDEIEKKSKDYFQKWLKD